MSVTYQTVIYYKPSGAILLVSPNLYISSKRHLAHLAHQPHWKDIGFIYFPFDLVIDISQHFVRSLSPNFPPSLVTKDGVPIEYGANLLKQKALLSKGGNFLVIFKAGMGDQLFEAAALVSAQDIYKHSTFSVQVEREYLQIMQHVVNFPPVQISYAGSASKGFSNKVSNDTFYVSDPRPSMPGKPSLYGSFLGLNAVNKPCRIQVTKSDYKAESTLLSTLNLDKANLSFAIHFHSRSGHGKNWHVNNVIELSKRLKSSYNCNIFVLGVEKRIPHGTQGIVDLTGKTNWFQTCLIISLVNLVICIDSGVLHIARSLGIPYVALWGGTTPKFILGSEHPIYDIVSRVPNMPRGSHQAPDDNNIFINKITPDMVMKSISRVLKLKEGPSK